MVITHLLNGMILQVEDQGSDELVISPALEASTVMRFARGEPASDLSDLLLALFTYWTLGVKFVEVLYGLLSKRFRAKV